MTIIEREREREKDGVAVGYIVKAGGRVSVIESGERSQKKTYKPAVGSSRRKIPCKGSA